MERPAKQGVPDVALSASMSELAQWYARRTGIAFGFVSADTSKLVGDARLVAGCERCEYVGAVTTVPMNHADVQVIKTAAMQQAALLMEERAAAVNCPHWEQYVRTRKLMGK